MSSDRTDPPLAADEFATLRGFLDFQRATFEWKCAGLTSEQLNANHPPSAMTLGGMMKHLALVEWWWFEHVFADNGASHDLTGESDDDVDWDWHTAVDDSPEELHRAWRARVEAADTVVGAHRMQDLSVHRDRHNGQPFSLRWIVLHMIEEYARHNGHADLIRESIDGETGE